MIRFGALGLLLAVLGLTGCQKSASSSSTSSSPTLPPIERLPRETPEEKAARLKWFQEARFGMFIHWGVYAVPAGEYHGKPIEGYGEWIMHHASIPVSEYKAFAKDFTASDYDPKAWAALAKEAAVPLHGGRGEPDGPPARRRDVVARAVAE